ncbi:ABC-three component system middle component 6 [Salinibacterium sp. ZJ450]|uniref:ABC-three component system middle component 6 n=1 Tax=Salinibacterium sp. ZJ450 TaxID=2708338 RepID=UPI00142291D4
MITPTKGIAPQRALVSVAAQVAMVLKEPMTISQTWASLKEWRERNRHTAPISFGWFVLAVDVLFALGALEYDEGLLRKKGQN